MSKLKGTEVSVDFKVYSDSHRIADAQYQTFPSEKPAYSTVIDDAAAWATANAKMFEATSDNAEDNIKDSFWSPFFCF